MFQPITTHQFPAQELLCCFQNSKWQYVQFYVVNVSGSAVLGLPSCETMKVVTLHCLMQSEPSKLKNIQTVKDIMSEYPDQFDSIGCFPNIEEPTQCINSHVTKRDVSLKMCLNPRALYKAFIRPLHANKKLGNLITS